MIFRTLLKTRIPLQQSMDSCSIWRLAYKHRDQQRPWGLLRLSLADETFGITRLPDAVGPVLPHGLKLDVLHGELCMLACMYL